VNPAQDGPTCSSPPPSTDSRWKTAVLLASEADRLPKLPLRQAYFDAFFAHLGYAYPIIERHEIEGPRASILLQQAVCFAGSLMRNPSLPDSFTKPKLLYERLKMLICLNVETDMLMVLKAMCLMMLWSPHPSNMVSLDAPWHATGNALRLAFHMGLHRYHTYRNKSNAACLRRLWWLLVVRS
jgi:hypothetical protein